MYSHLASLWIYILILYLKFRPKPPYYVKQHLEETTTNRMWLMLPNFVKKSWLDLDLFFHNLSKRMSRWYSKKRD